MALVDKVESEKELDGSRKLVAYATVCLAGKQKKNNGLGFELLIDPGAKQIICIM